MPPSPPPWSRRWPGPVRTLGRSLLPHLLPHLLPRLLPSSCALCGIQCRDTICAPCHGQFLAPRRPRCPRCGNPAEALDAHLPCGACQSHPPAFDATVVAVDYDAPLDQLVLQLKFGAELALAPVFGQALAEAVTLRADFGSPAALPTILCPVPLGPQRLVERGFNQALEIARPLARRLDVAVHPALAVRARDTPAQSGVAPAERNSNIRGAFVVAPRALALVRGQHIGVVDDVMTSGATLHELAAVFKRFGAVRVSNFVFARTPPH